MKNPVNIIFNNKRLKIFPENQELLLNIVLEVLVRSLSKKRNFTNINWKGKSKTTSNCR
jgi:hypothetical protein